MSKHIQNRLEEISRIIVDAISDCRQEIMDSEGINALFSNIDEDNQEAEELLQETFANLCDCVSSTESVLQLLAAEIMLQKFRQREGK